MSELHGSCPVDMAKAKKGKRKAKVETEDEEEEKAGAPVLPALGGLK